MLSDSDAHDDSDDCPHDARSIHVGLFGPGDQLVGTVRVIVAGPDNPIPVAGAPFNVQPAARPHGEISRYVVAPGWNGLGLVPAAWREVFRISQDEGLYDLYAEVEGFLLDSLLSAGLPFEVLGPPQRVYGAANYPVRLRMDTLPDELLTRNPALAVFAFVSHARDSRSTIYSPGQLNVDAMTIERFRNWWVSQRSLPAGWRATYQRPRGESDLRQLRALTEATGPRGA